MILYGDPQMPRKLAWRVTMITEAWRCSECGAEIDVEAINSYDLQVERSGVQPSSPDGPAVHWFEGTIACPGCGVRLPYGDSN